jgi:2-methylcitrate dehydratase
MTASVQLRLAEIAGGIRFDALPDDVVRHAKRLILDTLGCALGSFSAAPSEVVRKTIAQLGGTPEATVMVSGERTSCALATLANGTMIRHADSNDYYFGRDPAHPSGNLAAILAVGERQSASGRDVIAAMAAAYEIHIRLADHAGEPNIWQRGWHHGTNTQFAAAAAAARLLGGDVDVIATAMAIAGSHNNTLAQLQSGGISMMKATGEATIAKGGVEAALLACNGLTGPAEIFEGRSGWGKGVAGSVDFERLAAPIGGYRILDACIKPYATVASALASVQAAIDIKNAHRPVGADIEEMTVSLASYALNTPSFDPAKLDPQNKETADHSFHYCAAVALLDGDCGEAQFTDERLRSPDVRALMKKIVLKPDDEFTRRFPQAAGGAVELRMSDGRVYQRRCPYPPGHSQNPLDDKAVQAKFRQLSAHQLSAGGADAIIDAVQSFEQVARVGDFMKLLVTRSSTNQQ